MRILLLSLIVLISVSSTAQDSSNISTSGVRQNLPKTYSNTPPVKVSAEKFNLLSSYEFYLSIAILLFGLIVIGLEVFLIRTHKISADQLVKFIVITLIVTATLFLITAGYNNDQIAPAIGLFGTVAGYLLGRAGLKKEENET